VSGTIETRQPKTKGYLRTKSAPHVSSWFHAKFALCPTGTGKFFLSGTIC